MYTFVTRFIHDFNNNSIDRANVELTNSEEVKSFVSSLKNNKAPGLDGINSIILKNMPDYFFEFLSKLFNFF